MFGQCTNVLKNSGGSIKCNVEFLESAIFGEHSVLIEFPKRDPPCSSPSASQAQIMTPWAPGSNCKKGPFLESQGSKTFWGLVKILDRLSCWRFRHFFPQENLQFVQFHIDININKYKQIMADFFLRRQSPLGSWAPVTVPRRPVHYSVLVAR